MTPQELLTPRYKCIADYPDNTRQVGDIIVVEQKERSDEWYNQHLSFFNRYPHLFQPLQWWEYRELKDMPEYVSGHSKIIDINKEKVIHAKWRLRHGQLQVLNMEFEHQRDWFSVDSYTLTPATQSEYETYINSKK